jgi:hypothetical protein
MLSITVFYLFESDPVSIGGGHGLELQTIKIVANFCYSEI